MAAARAAGHPRAPGGRLVNARGRRIERRAAATGVAALLTAVSLLAAAATGASLTPSYRDEVLADGPAGYWRLGERTGTAVADQTANATTGTYVNGVTLGAAGALVSDPDPAASFDGGNDMVVLGDPASGVLDFGTRDFTAEAWVNVTANDERAIVGKRDATRFWQVTLTDDPNHAGHLRANVNDGAVARQAYSTRRVDDGRWHHVVVRFDRDVGISFYIDAVAAGATAAPMAGDLSNGGGLQVAKISGYPNLRGGVDEVAVYPSLLSPERIGAHYYASAFDDTAPLVSLATPGNGTSTGDTTPALSGTAGTVLGDLASVTVSVHPGSDLTAPALRRLEAVRGSDGAFAIDATPALDAGTYTARAEQADRAGNVGVSAANTFTVEGEPPSTDPVLAGAGDIAGCGGQDEGDEVTADLLEKLPGAVVATFGDNAYPDGRTEDFANCYEPSWGRLRSRTRPAAGGHEYRTSNAAPYFAYFGAAAGDPTKGYYSYDVGAWHVIVLNSQCDEVGGCGPGSPQERWLRTDLYDHPSSCVLAYWHTPRFSSGSTHGSHPTMAPFWEALHDYGADVVLGGHEHVYERFLPQAPDGASDPTNGITQFTVGTGGYYLYGFGVPLANSAARIDGVYGVIKLTLHPTSYDWKFVPVAGQTATDSGTAGCVDPAEPPPPPPPPSPPPPDTSGRYTAAVLTDVPRAYWQLGESTGSTAADQMGIAPGTYQSGVTLGLAGALAGDGDTAVGLDGGDDKVNARDPADGSLDFGLEDFTAEAWVRATANDERAVISKREVGSAPYWQVTVTDDGSQIGRIRASIFDGATTLRAYGPPIRVDDNAWHHVAVAFDRDAGITIYVDGVAKTTPGAVPGDLSNAASLLIAKATGYPFLKGEADEVAVYPQALDAERVKAHHDIGRSAG